MVRRTWGVVGGMEADHWKVGGMLITGRCVFVPQNKKGFQPTLASWARVKAPIVCENPNFLADEISMLVVQNVCVVHQHLQLFWLPKVIWQSQTSKKARPLFLISQQLIATPSWQRPGPWYPVACPVAVGHPGWVRVPLPVGNSRNMGNYWSDPSHAIPGGPWQLVHSWWEPHGSDMAVIYPEDIWLSLCQT